MRAAGQSTSNAAVRGATYALYCYKVVQQLHRLRMQLKESTKKERYGSVAALPPCCALALTLTLNVIVDTVANCNYLVGGWSGRF